MTRAQRRTNDFKKKAKASAILKRWNKNPTPVEVGRAASMHNTCPCWMCTEKEDENKRRFLSDLTKLHGDT